MPFLPVFPGSLPGSRWLLAGPPELLAGFPALLSVSRASCRVPCAAFLESQVQKPNAIYGRGVFVSKNLKLYPSNRTILYFRESILWLPDSSNRSIHKNGGKYQRAIFTPKTAFLLFGEHISKRKQKIPLKIKSSYSPNQAFYKFRGKRSQNRAQCNAQKKTALGGTVFFREGILLNGV